MKFIWRGNFMTPENADVYIASSYIPAIVEMEKPAFEDRSPLGAPCRYPDWVYDKLGRGEYSFLNRYHLAAENEGKTEYVPVCWCVVGRKPS
jgi:hypothetical protein